MVRRARVLHDHLEAGSVCDGTRSIEDLKNEALRTWLQVRHSFTTLEYNSRCFVAQDTVALNYK